MTESATVIRPSVSFVLPAYDEEANIGEAIERTIRAARRLCSEFEVLVVDDGSTDATSSIVDRASEKDETVKLIRHEVNRGYGEALRSGFRAAGLDYVFFTDADNQFDLEELELLTVWTGRADAVAGYRRKRRDPAMRRLNAWGWNRLVRLLYYVPVRDIDCAFKLFRREALSGIDIESGGAMINTEIMVKLARSGCTIVEVGVTHFPRKGGAPHGAKLAVIVRALRELWRMYPVLHELAPAPDRLEPSLPAPEEAWAERRSAVVQSPEAVPQGQPQVEPAHSLARILDDVAIDTLSIGRPARAGVGEPD